MTVQPKHDRMDLPVVVLDGLRGALPGSEVALDRDASYTPDKTMTVVQVPQVRSSGRLPGNRWLFDCMVTLTTTGPTFSAAADEADRVGDAVLSLTDVGDVLVSNVICDSEPVRMSPHDPTGAESLVQTFSLMVRRKGQSDA
ncbi:hypothetical protein [Corynebacterium sp. AOP12-C2-36]|uniref:hypothetical protein n=1 Tax=Corynebacterium sp. AOP12-C2-36 TaxID=3457723 RepID=UPI004033186A